MPQVTRKALVIDDERHIARLVEVNLQRAGFAVTVANDELSAWNAIGHEIPDLIVLDVELDEGWNLLRDLKADRRTKNVSIMMFSKRAPQAEVFRGWGTLPDIEEWFKDDSGDETPQ